MRLISDDVDFDAVDATERTTRWENVRIGMKLGLITPENFNWEDRNAVYAFLDCMPVVEMYDPRVGAAKIFATVYLVEGRDWCFATTRDGTFGVFSLDPQSRALLEGAVFHLWVKDSIIDPHDEGRLDFTDIREYLDAALDASLAA